jgi:hypothetical protein
MAVTVKYKLQTLNIKHTDNQYQNYKLVGEVIRQTEKDSPCERLILVVSMERVLLVKIQTRQRFIYNVAYVMSDSIAYQPRSPTDI